MTSVVGILSKQGAAIAADSAVTRRRTNEGGRLEKVTKNGNKMVRLSNADNIAVMITGSAEFLGVPWDVIIRRYRQKKGNDHQPSVEAAVKDFFDFIAATDVFWNQDAYNYFLHYIANRIFHDVTESTSPEDERKSDGTLARPAAFKKAFLRELSAVKRYYTHQGLCSHFKDYSLEEFRASAETVFDRLFQDESEEYPRPVLDAIRPDFEKAVLSIIGSRLELSMSATLVFVGFGANQDYPSLVAVNVCEGYAGRVNYSVRPEDIVCISDKKPVAICPYAQKDVIKSIIRGIHKDWSENVLSNLRPLIDGSFIYDLLNPTDGENDLGLDFNARLYGIDGDDLFDEFCKEGMQMLDQNQQQWEKALQHYDLEEMAALADSLINLTGFHRILTFSQEGVGGLVDLAVISKNDGFTWLRRKSWYHKDVGMKNGEFGI